MGANVWLLKGYFDTVPRELDEAAKVDGASHARIFFTMTLRLVMPILVTVFMVSFVGLFSEFLLASIFLRDIDTQTLGVGLYGMTIGTDAAAAARTAGAAEGARSRRSCAAEGQARRRLIPTRELAVARLAQPQPLSKTMRQTPGAPGARSR